MRHTFIISLLFIVTLIGVKMVNAQHVSAIESISQAHFQQLTYDQKKVLVQSWINQSQSVKIITTFEEKAKEFYNHELYGADIYLKYSQIFRVLFNAHLHPVDRINFCNFLLETFSDEEIPMQLIREQKANLILVSPN